MIRLATFARQAADQSNAPVRRAGGRKALALVPIEEGCVSDELHRATTLTNGPSYAIAPRLIFAG
jgi:hypothetical protein